MVLSMMEMWTTCTSKENTFHSSLRLLLYFFVSIPYTTLLFIVIPEYNSYKCGLLLEYRVAEKFCGLKIGSLLEQPPKISLTRIYAYGDPVPNRQI